MTDRVLSLLDPPPEQPVPADASMLAPPAGWPAPPASTVYHELLGEIVNTIAPHTEADPIAILTQLLVAFGATVGRGAFFTVEATRHAPNEFMLLVGDSSRARKGSSWDHVHRLITVADRSIEHRILTGLSSGEGLIFAVRDPAGQDPGHPDQRLLVIEPEFASVLKATSREISTLSPTLRSAWDGRPLAILTRAAPARSSTAHISVIGHITQHELRRYITAVELSNGYLNRILLIACRRQRLLPEGGNPEPLAGTGLDRMLAAAIKHAQTAGEIRLAPDGRELWHHAYHQLAAQPADGIIGQITARAEAHVIRLALLYTLADGQSEISTGHLTAALAMHDYAARSADWALASATGQPLAEQIHAALRQHPGGLTRSQISSILSTTSPPARSTTPSKRSTPTAARPSPAKRPAAAPRSSGPPRADPPRPRVSGSHRSSPTRSAPPVRLANRRPTIPGERSASERRSRSQTRDAQQRHPTPRSPFVASRSASPRDTLGVTSSFVPDPPSLTHTSANILKLSGAQHVRHRAPQTGNPDTARTALRTRCDCAHPRR